MKYALLTPKSSLGTNVLTTADVSTVMVVGCPASPTVNRAGHATPASAAATVSLLEQATLAKIAGKVKTRSEGA
jgi:hypothetical protein